jgi:hypothetical protein
MKAYGESACIDHTFLTSAIVGGEWSASRLGSFTPGERAPGTRLIGDGLSFRAGLNDVKNRKFFT